LLALSIVVALCVGVSAAMAGEGSQPSPRSLCTKGRWQQWPVPTGGQFQSESKCVNFLQSVQQDCRSVDGKFGADNQNGPLEGARVLWTCNGDGVTLAFVESVLAADCTTFANALAWSRNGTEGVSAMSCFLS
jgi:hypothetical protein